LGSSFRPDQHGVNIAVGVLIAIMLITFFLILLLQGYFLWVIYSFVKYLSLGQIDVIEGRDTILVHQVPSQPQYSPPINTSNNPYSQPITTSYNPQSTQPNNPYN
jgi:hypothetical protein